MPKNCAFCRIGTEGVPTFRVTPKRIEKWANAIGNGLKVGDRICQMHFINEEITLKTYNNQGVKVST